MHEPSRPNHKLADYSLKNRIQGGEFSDGLVWLVLDMYLAFKRSGVAFRPIPSVMEATENAEEGGDEGILACLSKEIEFSDTLRKPEGCKIAGFVLKSEQLWEVLKKKREEPALAGKSLECIRMFLNDNGYASARLRDGNKRQRVNYGARMRPTEAYAKDDDDFS